MAKRKFTNEYKAEAVKLVLEQGLSVYRAAQDLGLKDTTLRGWIQKARAGVLNPNSPKSQELEELKRLRREVVVLKQEREILKKKPRPVCYEAAQTMEGGPSEPLYRKGFQTTSSCCA